MPEASAINFQALYQEGNFRQIVQTYDTSDLTSESNPLMSWFYAAALFQLGELHSSLDILDSLESAFSDNVDFLSLHGVLCRRLGSLDRATSILRKALVLDPTSLAIRNNYSNLLIDLQKYDEAEAILRQLVIEKPDYVDAIHNINRLEFLKASRSDVSSQLQQRVSSVSVDVFQFADPLMLSFTPDEVALSTDRQLKAPSKQNQSIISQFPDSDPSKTASEQLRLAAAAITENNPTYALQLCSSAFTHIGPNQQLYLIVADAYISLKRFNDAEICILTAAQFSTLPFKSFINLSTLASIRHDKQLAFHYLSLAASTDPLNPNLVSLRNSLNNKFHKSSSPEKYSFLEEWSRPELQIKQPS